MVPEPDMGVDAVELVFNRALKFTIPLEGGFTLHNIPGDPGGMTYAGITRKYFPAWQGWQMIDEIRNEVRAADVIETNELHDAVKEVYRYKFWYKLNPRILLQVLTPEELMLVFDCAVNVGVVKTVKLVQQTVYVPDGNIDGIVGIQTKKCIRHFKEHSMSSFHAAFSLKRMHHYAQLVKRQPSLTKFHLGWISRVEQGWNLGGRYS